MSLEMFAATLDRFGLHPWADAVEKKLCVSSHDVHPAKRISQQQFNEWLEWFRQKPEVADARLIGSRSGLSDYPPRPGSDWDVAVVLKPEIYEDEEQLDEVQRRLFDEFPTRHLQIELFFIHPQMGGVLWYRSKPSGLDVPWLKWKKMVEQDPSLEEKHGVGAYSWDYGYDDAAGQYYRALENEGAD